MPLTTTISSIRNLFQDRIFPAVEDRTGPLTEKHRLFVSVLDWVKVETFFLDCPVTAGRPMADRVALASAFIAKAIWNLPTTRHLIDRLHADPVLRRLCGWERSSDVPSEATFSRAFAGFADIGLPGRMHEALIRATLGREDVLVGHLSRDSTAIEAREKPARKKKPEESEEAENPRKKGTRAKRKRSSGEAKEPEERRLEKQLAMTLPAMLKDLPKVCDIGAKKGARGFATCWVGYKLHLDTADGGIPVSCLLTSASTHDSQAAIPLATMSDQRVTSLYDLMDSAYDAAEIHAHSQSLGHVPLIDPNPRRNRTRKEALRLEARAQRAAGRIDAKAIRYRERTNVERVNARIKDDFGGRHVRVRGPDKVACHLMWGILALTVDQLLRLAV